MRPLLFFLISACLDARLNADSLTLSDGLVYDPIRIDRVADGKIYFHINDELRDKPVADVVTFKLDDEPDFSAADSAYQQKQWSAAADGYSRAIAATDKDWLKDFIAPRLLTAGNQTHHFD